MQAYHYPQRLREIWNHAVTLYQAGNREPAEYFDPATLEELAAIGLRSMDVYDYAEDFVSAGEPDFETFLMICEARRDYFLNVQGGRPSPQTIDIDALPPKDAAVRGIEWLPRILPKARAKLRGELPASLMFCCGGDRKFFKRNKLHPAEFLRAVWAFDHDEARLIDWVQARATSPADATREEPV